MWCFVFPCGLFLFLTVDLLYLSLQCVPEGWGAPLAPHKVLKSGALSSLGEAGRVAQWVAAARAALQHRAALVRVF
jgi:hypothetical protein